MAVRLWSLVVRSSSALPTADRVGCWVRKTVWSTGLMGRSIWHSIGQQSNNQHHPVRLIVFSSSSSMDVSVLYLVTLKRSNQPSRQQTRLALLRWRTGRRRSVESASMPPLECSKTMSPKIILYTINHHRYQQQHMFANLQTRNMFCYDTDHALSSTAKRQTIEETRDGATSNPL